MGSQDIDCPGPDYQTLAEKSIAGFYVLEEERLSYVNEGLCRILGYESRDELIGKPFGELIHPDDRKVFEGEITGQKGPATPGWRVAKVCRKDGSVIWALLEERAAPYHGRSTGMGCLIDFTPFKQAEESLRQSLERYEVMINEVEDAVAEVDLKGNIKSTNKAGCRIWGPRWRSP